MRRRVSLGVEIRRLQCRYGAKMDRSRSAAIKRLMRRTSRKRIVAWRIARRGNSQRSGAGRLETWRVPFRRYYELHRGDYNGNRRIDNMYSSWRVSLRCDARSMANRRVVFGGLRARTCRLCCYGRGRHTSWWGHCITFGSRYIRGITQVGRRIAIGGLGGAAGRAR